MSEAQTMQDQLGAAVHQNNALSRDGLLERVFSRLFQGLVYAQIWEDPVSDMGALRIQTGEHVVCIASGGCNMMSYLTARPGSISVVDLSPAHVALNRLKLAGAQHLTQAEFFRFFARADHGANPHVYRQKLRPHLDAESRAYWDGRSGLNRRIDMFAHGIYRYGLLGRFIGLAHLVSRLGRVDFKPFLRAETLEEQRAYYEAKVAPLFDMGLVRWMARRRASLFGLGIPPAQYDKLAADGGGDVIPVLRERVRKLMCDFPVADNYFAWQAFNRAYDRRDGGSVPPYLEPQHFEAVQAHAPGVSVENRALTDMLADAPAASKDCYVFLDAQDWMTDDQLNALWTEVTRTAKPGARVAFRTGGIPDILPGRVREHILSRWTYDLEASRTGFESDRSAIYGGFHLYRFGG
ncbi:MAG: DUF3419 family protein [Pseudomonadota bacterium]